MLKSRFLQSSLSRIALKVSRPEGSRIWSFSYKIIQNHIFSVLNCSATHHKMVVDMLIEFLSRFATISDRFQSFFCDKIHYSMVIWVRIPKKNPKKWKFPKVDRVWGDLKSKFKQKIPFLKRSRLELIFAKKSEDFSSRTREVMSVVKTPFFWQPHDMTPQGLWARHL